MELVIQIKSLLFSFFFGIVFSIVIDTFEKIIYHKKLTFQIINTFLISVFFCLLYFICIKKINYGVIHVYFILMILLGMFFDKRIFRLGKRIKVIIRKINFKRRTWHYLHQSHLNLEMYILQF